MFTIFMTAECALQRMSEEKFLFYAGKMRLGS
jgi:hypothetical protein